MVSAEAKDRVDLLLASALALCASMLMQEGLVLGRVRVSISESPVPSEKTAMFEPRHRGNFHTKDHSQFLRSTWREFRPAGVQEQNFQFQKACVDHAGFLKLPGSQDVARSGLIGKDHQGQFSIIILARV